MRRLAILGLLPCIWTYGCVSTLAEVDGNVHEHGAGTTNSMAQHLPVNFTTDAYEARALSLMVAEADKIARALDLSEAVPIDKTKLFSTYVAPPFLAKGLGTVGTIQTSNYMYCVSKDHKFSYLISARQEQNRLSWQNQRWPKGSDDAALAYQLATQWLAAISMDVQGLERDYRRFTTVEKQPAASRSSRHLPIYLVSWCKPWKTPAGIEVSSPPKWYPVASVLVFVPTKTLMELHVEDAKYILRNALEFPDLDKLLFGPGVKPMTKSLSEFGL